MISSYPIIEHGEIFYKSAPALSEELSPGITPDNGQELFVYRFRANGADPSSYVILVWDHGGEDEKVFCSTKGDIDLFFDSSNHDYHILGDGVKKLQIVIENNNTSASPIIGGAVELVGL